jgi:hypothetical protein
MMQATIIVAGTIAICLGLHHLHVLNALATDDSLLLPGIGGLLAKLSSICLGACSHVVHAEGAIRIIATHSRAARQID